MAQACARFGHPERAFLAVHVAGTNGKGSVSAMVAAMLHAEGRRVGLYTSPHLCRFAERIRIADEPIDDALLVPLLDEVLDGAPELTFFEAATLTAFLAIARAGVEIAVVEVGLGGRLDATNVLPSPLVTAITRIALDHVAQLGDSIASVAREKAGILKPGVPVVLGPIEGEALEEIKGVAHKTGTTLIFAEREAGNPLLDGPLGLDGAHQRDNAAIAISIAKHLGLRESAIAEGLREVRWPGRLETIQASDGTYLLDAAHNPDGASSLARSLRDRGLAPKSVSLVFGAMADKDYPAMLDLLAPLAEHRVFVAPQGRTPADPMDLAATFGGTTADSVADGVRLARDGVGPEGLVVIAGSIFLVGEARSLLLGIPRDPLIAL